MVQLTIIQHECSVIRTFFENNLNFFVFRW